MASKNAILAFVEDYGTLFDAQIVRDMDGEIKVEQDEVTIVDMSWKNENEFPFLVFTNGLDTYGCDEFRMWVEDSPECKNSVLAIKARFETVYIVI